MTRRNPPDNLPEAPSSETKADDVSSSLAAFFERHLPLAQATQVRILEAGPRRVQLWFPLEANINHHGTAFGGSISTAGILAGWSLVHLCLERENLDTAIVIADSRTRFRRPVRGAFTATAELVDEAALASLLSDLRTLGSGRLALRTLVHEQEGRRPAAVHEGLFVAARSSPARG